LGVEVAAVELDEAVVVVVGMVAAGGGVSGSNIIGFMIDDASD